MTIIARCPKHGLHGERSECFICGGPVEQIPMVPSDGAAVERVAREIYEQDRKMLHRRTGQEQVPTAWPHALGYIKNEYRDRAAAALRAAGENVDD